MNALLMVATCLAAQADQTLPPVYSTAQTAAINAVEEVFEADPELRRHHHGYRNFLATHPDVAAAEDAYCELAGLSGFGQAVRAFDEALAGDPASEALFDRYYAALAQDHSLRLAVEAIYRWELKQRRTRDIVTPALEYLRARPDQAIRLLGSPARTVAGPPEVRTFHIELLRRPAARDELLRSFLALHDKPRAHTHVIPWWQAIAVEAGETARAHRRMHAYLVDHAHHFWVWHRRQIALASHPHARDWIRYWRRRVRRTPRLTDHYEAYLKLLRDRPELRPLTPKAGDTGTPATPWPPHDNPPPLPPLPEQATAQERPLRRDLMPQRPSKPTVERPSRPQMPGMPTMPPVPAKPKWPDHPSGDVRP